MGALEKIEKAEIRDLLGKGWLTHDGMWFYSTYLECGIEKANQLNKAAIKSMAPFEMDRMKRILGIVQEDLENFDKLFQFMLAALELTLPESVFKNFHLTPFAENFMHWKWNDMKCFAYTGMKQIGLIDGYHCGVIYRVECWLDALGVKYATQPAIEGCLMHEKGVCEGDIQIFLSKGKKN